MSATACWLRFLIVPVALGLLTAADNSARFCSPFQSGYILQANGMNEPRCTSMDCFRFTDSVDAYHMLFEGFIESNRSPFMQPTPWGLSIFLASPFLFLLFREGGRYKVAAWTAIGLVTAVLWCHCNQGGWQYSYRYAMTLLPWMFLLLAGNGPRRLTVRARAFAGIAITFHRLAIPVDKPDTRMKRTRVPRMSPKRPREQAIYDRAAIEAGWRW